MYHTTITLSHGAPLVIPRMDPGVLNDLLVQWRTSLRADIEIAATGEQRVFVARRAIVHIIATAYA